MNAEPKAQLPEVPVDAAGTAGTGRTQSLAGLLVQSERVMRVLEECADGLVLSNASSTDSLARPLPASDRHAPALSSAAVAQKLHDAYALLSAVNRGLADEVRDRQMLDHQFAAAVEQEEAARRAALHDVLTGLPNRTLFNIQLQHAIAQAKRHGWTLVVMFVDLDNFKQINDTHGHGAGDEILVAVARRLKDSTRGDDAVSRHGGDEFLYLALELGGGANIALIAEKLIKTIQAPYDLGTNRPDGPLGVTASIGIAMYPKDGTTADRLINSADKAMYRAKRNQSRYAFAE